MNRPNPLIAFLEIKSRSRLMKLPVATMRTSLQVRDSLSRFHQRAAERRHSQQMQEQMRATSRMSQSPSPYSADSEKHSLWVGQQLAILMPLLPPDSVLTLVVHPISGDLPPAQAVVQVSHLPTTLAAMLTTEAQPESTQAEVPAGIARSTFRDSLN